MAFKVLILGGTSEGRRLAEQLAGDARYSALLSFAGRTRSLRCPELPYRVGGFGGIAGLVEFLRAGRYGALIDATHAFAAQMSVHAARAAELSATPLLRLTCPPWRRVEGDLWTHVARMAEAPAALGELPRRVFLSIGRLEADAFRAAPQHVYLVRAVDDFAPDLPIARVLRARGPFDERAERALLERERIEVLVSKNAGTAATYAKIAAARSLGLPVIMVARPEPPPARSVEALEGALDWLHALHHSLQRRGV